MKKEARFDIQHLPINKVKLNPDNPRQISNKDFALLVKSLKDCPDMFEARPLLISDRTGENIVLGGNMRLRAAKKLGYKEVPVIILPGLTEAQEKEIMIKDNGAWGTWDFDALANTWSDLPLNDWGVDIPETWLNDIAGDEEHDLLSNANEDIKGMGIVYDLRADVRFDGVGEFDIPALRSDMMLDIPAPSCWAGPRVLETESADSWLYNYGTDSIVGLDLSKTVISFYTEDARFEKLWNNTKEVAKRFLNNSVVGMVSPNFSTYFDWPRALRIYNVFRSRWVARYFQETGIRIIPDITGAPDDLFVMDGIPIKSPICIQVHRAVGTQEEIEKKRAIIKIAISKIKPNRIWVYGNKEKIEIYPELRDKRVEFILPRQHKQKAWKKDKETLNAKKT